VLVFGSEDPNLPGFQLKAHPLVHWQYRLRKLVEFEAVVTRRIESLEEQVHSVHCNSVWFHPDAKQSLSELILGYFSLGVV